MKASDKNQKSSHSALWKIFAVFMSVVLVVGFTPMPSYADGDDVDVSATVEGDVAEEAEDSQDEADASDGSAAEDGVSADGSGDSTAETGEDAAAEDDGETDAGTLISVGDAEDETGISADDEGTLYVEGEVLVTFESGTQTDEATDVVDESAAVSETEISEEDLIAGEISGGTLEADEASDPTVVLEVADGVTVVQAIADLQEDSTVAAVQPNYLYSLCEDEESDEDETLAGASGYTIDDTDLGKYNDTYWETLGVYDAWSLIRCENNVAIAVLDTGADVTHEDLADNVVATYNAYTGEDDVEDEVGHGTHVAGIASACANNATGMAGTSYNADLVIVNVFFYLNSSGWVASSSTMVAAFDWIIGHQSDYNIRVANMSLGSVVDSSYDWDDDALCAAIDSAEDAGILSVAAAGNSGSGLKVPYSVWPADYDSVLSVINLASSCTARSTSSNYNASGTTEDSVNATKDICAPGISVYSTSSGGGYEYMSGTSMASPVVAGIAALCFAANPSLTPGEVMEVLEETAYDLGDEGWDCSFGYGRVDAYAAVSAIIEDMTDEDGCISVDVPTAASGLTYTGSVQTGVSASSYYTLSGTYEATAAGTYTAVATLSDDGYVWSDGTTDPKEITWTISRASISKATVTLSTTSYTYNGKARKPGVTVKLNGTTLKSGTDYSVSYSNNTKAGTATVTVTGKGNYTGTAKKTFTIKAKTPSVSYKSYLWKYGWTGTKKNGTKCGTTLSTRQLQALKISVSDSGLTGSVKYRMRVQKSGWTGWKSNGNKAGVTGKSRKSSAIQIKLTGTLASNYDVYYRVRVKGIGWLGWAKNGASAGTSSYKHQVQAVQIVLVKKGSSAPSKTYKGITGKGKAYRSL